MIPFQKSPLAIGILAIASLWLVGCAVPNLNNPADKPAADTSEANNAAAGVPKKTYDSGEMPEKDCLGLTVDKAQKFCGSGLLKRDVGLLYGGYKCAYRALDPEGADKPDIGVALELTYATESQPLAELKEDFKKNNSDAKITDLANGFYGLTTVDLGFSRPTEHAEYFNQTNGLTVLLKNSVIDYEMWEDDTRKNCSTSELGDILASITGRAVGASSGSPGAAESTQFAPKTPQTTAPTAATKPCCEIIVANMAGAFETADGKRINIDDRLQVGDKMYTVDGDIIIAVICDDDLNNVKIFVVKTSEPMEVSIVEGADGKPIVKTDPGLATVSVKQLPQFMTDFQVSTPRLTCSVRG